MSLIIPFISSFYGVESDTCVFIYIIYVPSDIRDATEISKDCVFIFARGPLEITEHVIVT